MLLSFDGGKLSLSIKISWAGPSKSSNCPDFIAHKKANTINPININDIGINKKSISIFFSYPFFSDPLSGALLLS